MANSIVRETCLRPVSKRVEAQIEAARQVIFDVAAMAEVSAAACDGDPTPDENSRQRILWEMSRMLNRVNAMLDIVALERGDALSEEVANG